MWGRRAYPIWPAAPVMHTRIGVFDILLQSKPSSAPQTTPPYASLAPKDLAREIEIYLCLVITSPPSHLRGAPATPPRTTGNAQGRHYARSARWNEGSAPRGAGTGGGERGVFSHDRRMAEAGLEATFLFDPRIQIKVNYGEQFVQSCIILHDVGAFYIHNWTI